MDSTRLLRYGALCLVALACGSKAPEGPTAPGLRRAAAGASDHEPSKSKPIDDTPTAAPSSANALSVAPTASSNEAGRLSASGELPRVPRVRLHRVVVESGNLETEVLTRIVRQRSLELRDCYGQRLRERPQLEGQLHFRLQLSSNGDVSSATTIVNTLGDAEALACVQAIMDSLVLPGAGEPSVIVVPLTFAPSG